MLSVIVITKNEEANIRHCLESVTWANEIIVLDSGSTDQTVAIAKEFTAKVYCTDWPGYGVQKQRALNLATSEWVLNLDADECVSPPLKNAIQMMMRNPQAEAYRIPIQLQFYGKPLRFSSSPTRHARLFKRTGARFSNDIVHEKILLPATARIGRFKEPIYHQSFQDLSHALYKLNKYSSYSAKICIQKRKQAPGLLKILCSATWMFWRCYLLQGGIWEGRAGFILAYLNAQGTFFRGMKQQYHDKAIQNLPQVEVTASSPNVKLSANDEILDNRHPSHQKQFSKEEND